MPRSSRHKSQRQSKHSSRDGREHPESDVKMKDGNVKEEGSVRVSRDSGSSEKRKLELVKDDKSEEFVASKRRKEKADVSTASDRWNGVEKESKGDSLNIDADKGSKSAIDLKSKSRDKHDSGIEKRESVDLVAEKGESKRVDSKRKSEKDSGRREVNKEHKEPNVVKEKERGLERERKIEGIKVETEAARAVGNEVDRKKGSRAVDLGEERPGKRGREKTDTQDELRNPDLEKELEKRIRKRRDGSSDKDKHQEIKGSEDRRLSSKGEHANDGRCTDEKHKDGIDGDKHREDGERVSRKRDKYREDTERESRHRDDKHREDTERDSRHRDDKHREDGDRDNRHKDDKYKKDVHREKRHRDDKYNEDGNRDNSHRDHKYRDGGEKENSRRDYKFHEDGSRDSRHRGDKYHEDGDIIDRHKEEKYREDGNRDDRLRDEKYHEDGNRDDRRREEMYREDGNGDGRHRDDWYIQDGNRGGRNREEKKWEDGRDSRHRAGKQSDGNDRDKSLRDVKYQDERSSRDRSRDKSDIKCLRDESNAAELDYRKSNYRDGSPFYDDRGPRYKEDLGGRTANDKQDHANIRSRSTKDQLSDAAKKSTSSAKVESVSDRGRSNTYSTDLEITPNHGIRRSSPSSSSHGKDSYRLVKQEESKYRDYVHEERGRHTTSTKEFGGVAGVTEKASLSRSIEKSLQKDDIRVGELSTERRPKVDARGSPFQVVDKSPSSVSNDHRQLNRSDVRRSLDIEDSGQRSSGGSKEAKEFLGRGSRELAMDTLPEDVSQADGDNLSVSSPFSKTSHLSSNSRSLLPPPPLRMGVDSHMVLRSFENDIRGKSNNRHRRIGDPNMGRVQGSAWRGFPNWPSPVANGFIPFQHGPLPVGFHPMMQQFPAPPMFGVRPSIDIRQSGLPCHLPDGSRISGQGRPLGWRNQVDESCPPQIHGWDANNTGLGEELNMYGRLDRDLNRTPMGGRVWETSGDAWDGQSSGPSSELPSAPQKEDYSVRGPVGEGSAGQSPIHFQTDKEQPSVLPESIDIDHSRGARERNILEDPNTTSEEIHNITRKHDICLSHVYLSVLDVSADLTQPELYSQFTSLMGIDQNTNFEEDDSKYLVVEETINSTVKIPSKTSSSSLFSTINDSVFQTAISLYKKLREEVKAFTGEKLPFDDFENLESAPPLYQVGAGPNDDQRGEVVPACDVQEAAGLVSALDAIKIEMPPAISCEKMDEPALGKSESSNAVLTKVKIEYCDSVSKQEAADNIVKSPGIFGEVSRAMDYKVDHSTANNEEQKSHEANCGPLLFSDASAEAFEAVMPKSIESGSVNLSRIHQSPESTH